MQARTFRRPLSARNLDAYRVARELNRYCNPFIARTARHDKKLAEQLGKALPSVPQNFSEGMRRTGNDRHHLLTVALGSADEVRSILDNLEDRGIIRPDEARHADHLADRFCAMTYRLAEDA
jgi:four helix bundle protein